MILILNGVEIFHTEIEQAHEEVIQLDMRSYQNGFHTLIIQPEKGVMMSKKLMISRLY